MLGLAVNRIRSWHRGLQLQNRFMLHFGAIVLSLMALVVLLMEHTIASTVLHQTQLRGMAIANSIAAVVKGELLTYDYVSLQQAADTADHDEGVLYVIILDKEHAVAAYSSRPEFQGRKLTDAVSQSVDRAGGMLIQRLDAAPESGIKSAYLDIAVPVRVHGTPVQWGTVRIGLSLAGMMATLARVRFALVMLSVAAVLIVLVSARILSRQITKPLGDLAEATAVVSTGDLDHPVDERLVGELGDLARSFNKMMNDLKRSRDAIRYQNQHLENMVRLRTAALQDKAIQLELANAELKELDRLKSDFLSNVSHELRTPLTSIRSFTEIMIDAGDEITELERHEFLQIVSDQAQRLTRLISDLLDLSKMEAGEFHCQLASLGLELVAQSCTEVLRAVAGEKGIKLHDAIASELPPVMADRDRINQVMTNLLHNAIKFTPTGGAITITGNVCSLRRPVIGVLEPGESPPGAFHGMESPLPEGDSYLVVSVRDTGIGIRSEDQERIFDKFGQVGNILTDKPQGTGLGLAISGSIVVQHGGALWVESAPGHGSVFSFSLPVVESVRVKRAAGSTPRVGMADSENSIVRAVRRTTPGKQILVVDDEPAIVTALTELLQPCGYRVVGCQSGSQAVARARELQPDAIILDIMMPEINGYDVLRLLKSDVSTAGIPVIVLSVLDDKQKAFELGATEYVRKPFEKNELLDNVRALT